MTSGLDIARQAEFDRRPVAEEDVQEALKYIQALHGDADGWIPLFNKPLYGGRKTWCYKVNDITTDILKEKWAGKVNTYVGLSTMFVPRRKNKNTRQLRAIGLDLDYRYVEGLRHLSHDEFITLLERDYFGKVIPNPNVILHGYNVQVIILLEPAPYKQTRKLWKALVRHFVSAMRDLGADGNCTDFARVMRLPGTWHREGMKITADYRHTHRYSLRELQERFLPPLPPNWKEQRAERRGKKRLRSKRPAIRQPLDSKKFTKRSLNQQRMRDLEKLCELRNWSVRGHRELILFLYRYHALLSHGLPTLAYQQILDLNSRFKEPLEEMDATNSAEEMWRDLQNKERAEERRQTASQEKGVEYTRAGYNYRNQTLLQLLDTSAEEEAQLTTIISEIEKKRREKRRDVTRKDSRAQRRRVNGQKTREEYLAPTVIRRQKAWEMRQMGFTIREIAGELGCVAGTVHRLLKQVEEGKFDVQRCVPLDCEGAEPCPNNLQSDYGTVRMSDAARRLIAWYGNTLVLQTLPNVEYDPDAERLACSDWSELIFFQVAATTPVWLDHRARRYAAAWFHLHKEPLSARMLVAVLVSALCHMSHGEAA